MAIHLKNISEGSKMIWGNLPVIVGPPAEGNPNSRLIIGLGSKPIAMVISYMLREPNYTELNRYKWPELPQKK